VDALKEEACVRERRGERGGGEEEEEEERGVCV
jgi:hypothetical protein